MPKLIAGSSESRAWAAALRAKRLRQSFYLRFSYATRSRAECASCGGTKWDFVISVGRDMLLPYRRFHLFCVGCGVCTDYFLTPEETVLAWRKLTRAGSGVEVVPKFSEFDLLHREMNIE